MTGTGNIYIRVLVRCGLAGVLLALAIPGCADGPADQELPAGSGNLEPVAAENLPTLFLVLAYAQEDSVAVDLVYSPKEGQSGPRMVELFLQVGSGLTYASSTPLAAVDSAGKQLVVQPTDDGLVRTVIFATNNLERLQAGSLVRYIFLRGTGPHHVELLDRHPIFAPADTEKGLTLGEPLIIGGP